MAREALRNLVEALQVVGNIGIRFVLYTLPVLLIVVGPFAFLAWWPLRRSRRPKHSPIGPKLGES